MKKLVLTLTGLLAVFTFIRVWSLDNGKTSHIEHASTSSAISSTSR